MRLIELLKDGGWEDALCWIGMGAGLALMYVAMFALCAK